MLTDVRESAEHAAVVDHLRRLHEPGFGHPHALSEPHASADGSRVVVTGSVLDELAGLPRTAVYAATDGELTALTTGAGSARWGRLSPDGATLAFLSDRSEAGRFQLCLLEGTRFGEAVAGPEVPGSIEYAHWSPDGRRLVLGVAGLGAALSGGQGATANVAVEPDLPSWHPTVEDGASESAWRSLWVYTLDTGELAQVSPQGMNCWEAGWCGLSQRWRSRVTHRTRTRGTARS